MFVKKRLVFVILRILSGLNHKYMNKTKLYLIGLWQALGVVAYCALVGGFIWYGERLFGKLEPGYLNVVLVLMLLVFSVALVGSILFAYPAYLSLNQKIKEALTLVAYTLLYSLGLLGVIIILLVIFK